MTNVSHPLILLHGAWHGAWCWSHVEAHLAGRGRISVAVDMAGHGLNAERPRCFTDRSADPRLVSTEKSPVAEVDLDQAGDLLVKQIRDIGGGEPVTVVAHSMGGTVLTRAAQQAPDLIGRAVYLTAFMPASDVNAFAYAASAENAGELVTPALQGNPAEIGALRIDSLSEDLAYRQRLREAFYGDVASKDADAAIGLLTPDLPAGIPLSATTLSSDGWGSVPRTYIRCSRDYALRPDLQDRFIEEADAAFPENPTSVATLDSAHSPFFSMPETVAELLAPL